VEFAATTNVTVAGPVPDVVPSVIQGVEVEAVQEHASPLVALKLKFPPSAGAFCDVTVNVYAQPGVRTSTKSSVVLLLRTVTVFA
jgi:hypothetical protein